MSLKHSKKMTHGRLFDDLCLVYKKISPKEFVYRANKFLNIYPGNVHIRYLRGISLKKMNLLEEASEDIEFAYTNDRKKVNSYSVELFYLYYYLGDYEKALSLFPEVKKINLIDEEKIKLMNIVIKNSLNILSYEDKFRINTYSSVQIVDYNRNEAIQHLQNHQYGYDDTKSQFKSKINFEYLFDLVENNITPEERNLENAAMDIYYFGIYGIGYDYKGDNANFVKVVVVPNTKNIITIFPTNRVPKTVKNLEYDYNKLFSLDNKSKTKRISQIDKFNNRYKSTK